MSISVGGHKCPDTLSMSAGGCKCSDASLCTKVLMGAKAGKLVLIPSGLGSRCASKSLCPEFMAMSAAVPSRVQSPCSLQSLTLPTWLPSLPLQALACGLVSRSPLKLRHLVSSKVPTPSGHIPELLHVGVVPPSFVSGGAALLDTLTRTHSASCFPDNLRRSDIFCRPTKLSKARDMAGKVTSRTGCCSCPTC